MIGLGTMPGSFLIVEVVIDGVVTVDPLVTIVTVGAFLPFPTKDNVAPDFDARFTAGVTLDPSNRKNVG